MKINWDYLTMLVLFFFGLIFAIVVVIVSITDVIKFGVKSRGIIILGFAGIVLLLLLILLFINKFFPKSKINQFVQELLESLTSFIGDVLAIGT